jgi:transposase
MNPRQPTQGMVWVRCFLSTKAVKPRLQGNQRVLNLANTSSILRLIVYKYQSVKTDIDTSRALGIDPGLNNWLTCVSNVGTSLIVDGLRLKSLHQAYNKRVSTLKENQSQGFWSKRLAGITEK